MGGKGEEKTNETKHKKKNCQRKRYKGCQEALCQGRYTWTHNSVLNCLISLISDEIPCSSKLYVDLPVYRTCESPPANLPANVSIPTARPDLILTSEDSVTMIELTIPTNSKEAMQKANSNQAMQKAKESVKPNYISLIGDLEERGLTVIYQTLEIGSLGHYHMDAIHCISKTFLLSKSEAKCTLRRQQSYAPTKFLSRLAGAPTNPFFFVTILLHLYSVFSLNSLISLANIDLYILTLISPPTLPCQVLHILEPTCDLGLTSIQKLTQKFKDLFSPLRAYGVETCMFEGYNHRESRFERYCKNINGLLTKQIAHDKKQEYLHLFSPDNWKSQLPGIKDDTHLLIAWNVH